MIRFARTDRPFPARCSHRVSPQEVLSVSVAASVASPCAYQLPAKGATLLKAVTVARGLKNELPKTSNKRQIPLGEEMTMKVDYDDVLSGKSPDPPLQEGGVSIVRQSFF